MQCMYPNIISMLDLAKQSRIIRSIAFNAIGSTRLSLPQKAENRAPENKVAVPYKLPRQQVKRLQRSTPTFIMNKHKHRLHQHQHNVYKAQTNESSVWQSGMQQRIECALNTQPACRKERLYPSHGKQHA